MSESLPPVLPRDQELADALFEGIVVLDQSARILWWNRSAKKLLSLRKEHNGVCIQDVLRGESARILFQSPNKSVQFDRKIGRKTLHLSLSLIPYRENKQLLTIQDISTQKRAEIMRKDFIGNVSHELRTPLTVFRGYLELFSDNPAALLGEEKVVLDHMTEQCHRMEVLINGVLLLSRLEENAPDFSMYQPVTIPPLIDDIIGDAKRLSGGKHTFSTTIDHNIVLLGHSMELRSLFSNLIYNAVRYTPAGGKINIAWFTEEGKAVFQVKDTGIGIAVKHIDKITQRFYRVDKSRPYHSEGGTGLGLAIAKHILIRHNGELKINSHLGDGSTFSCYFSDFTNITQAQRSD